MAQFQQWGDDAGLQNQHKQQVLSTKPDIADPSKWEYADSHELLNMWDIEVLPEPPSWKGAWAGGLVGDVMLKARHVFH